VTKNWKSPQKQALHLSQPTQFGEPAGRSAVFKDSTCLVELPLSEEAIPGKNESEFGRSAMPTPPPLPPLPQADGSGGGGELVKRLENRARTLHKGNDHLGRALRGNPSIVRGRRERRDTHIDSANRMKRGPGSGFSRDPSAAKAGGPRSANTSDVYLIERRNTEKVAKK